MEIMNDKPISNGSQKTKESMKNKTAQIMLDKDTILPSFKVSRNTASNMKNINGL